jgi:uncharacterized membrane protein YfcA
MTALSPSRPSPPARTPIRGWRWATPSVASRCRRRRRGCARRHIGLALLLARGLALAVRALAGRMRRAKRPQWANALRPFPHAPHPLWIALGGLLAGLVLPACGLLLQPFLALGDLTPATAALAAGTALLPVALLAALAVHWRTGPRSGWAAVDAAAMLAIQQAGVLLAAWGWWPVRLWH